MLQYEMPGLSEKLESLTVEKRLKVLLGVSYGAALLLPDVPKWILDLIHNAILGGSISENELQDLEEFSEMADKNYFTDRENGADESAWQNWFNLSRLAAGVIAVLASKSFPELANGAYELCFANKDKSSISTLFSREIDIATQPK